MQPGTYGLIHRNLLRTHADSPSLSWDELAQAAATEPATVAEERVLVSCTGTALVQPEGAKPHRDFTFRRSFRDEPLASFTLGAISPLPL